MLDLKRIKKRGFIMIKNTMQQEANSTFSDLKQGENVVAYLITDDFNNVVKRFTLKQAAEWEQYYYDQLEQAEQQGESDTGLWLTGETDNGDWVQAVQF